jgi:hypothetical protein
VDGSSHGSDRAMSQCFQRSAPREQCCRALARHFDCQNHSRSFALFPQCICPVHLRDFAMHGLPERAFHKKALLNVRANAILQSSLPNQHVAQIRPGASRWTSSVTKDCDLRRRRRRELFLGECEKVTVFNSCPSHLRDGIDIMPGDFPREPPIDAFVE